jgi:NAD(P)-dependent dehydrogenase (short-subunit alcohol dehydrogenase family)
METSTVCITGASRGLGNALVRAFLERPYMHVAAVTRNSGILNDLISEYPDRLKCINADVCTAAGREDVYQALSGMPPLAILIHNAGSLVYAPFEEIEETQLSDVYKVNVFAPYLLTQRLLPLMGATHVISISSVGGVQGSLKFAGLSAYSSSKAALNCLTEMWSEEYKDTQLVFNCLALGSVDTDMFNTAFPGFTAASTPEVMARYIAQFAFEAPSVMRGKIISLSLGNP